VSVIFCICAQESNGRNEVSAIHNAETNEPSQQVLGNVVT
jgi:hypothetical protein